MARGRIISPDFWTDGNMIGLSFPARLFYIGLWNFTYCDKGHLPDDVTSLKLKVLPADLVDADALMGELMDATRVVRISAGGQSYLHIPTLESHQKADSRWKSRCPVCNAESTPKLNETPASLVEHAETQPSSALRQDKTRQEDMSSKAELDKAVKSPYSKLFLSWWEAYPRKESKGDAWKAWEVLRKARQLPDESLLAAETIGYANKVRGDDPKFVKLPAGWLRDRKWEDEKQNASSPAKTTTVADIAAHKAKVMAETEARHKAETEARNA